MVSVLGGKGNSFLLINRKSNKPSKHPYIEIKAKDGKGKPLKIDKKLYPLIVELNKVGLITTQCCQGDEYNLPYISLSMANIEDVAIRQSGKRLVIWWKG